MAMGNWIAVLAVALVSVSSAAWGEVRYQITDLGVSGQVYAMDINSSGQVAIESEGAYSLYSGQRLTDLYPFFPSCINDSGVLAGCSTLPDYTKIHPAIYDDGQIVLLDTREAFGYGINNAGQVVGEIYKVGASRAFFYSDGQMTELTVPGAIEAWATDINDSGVIVGYARVGATQGRCFLYAGGQATYFGETFQGHIPGHWKINNGGVVAGAWEVAGKWQGYVYADGHMSLIDAPMHTVNVKSINNDGVIVGAYRAVGAPVTDYHAFLYEDASLTDLNMLIDPTSGWVLADAAAINDRGQIAGWGFDPTGSPRAFLLTPIPEPATVSLLAAGCLVAMRRRCRR